MTHAGWSLPYISYLILLRDEVWFIHTQGSVINLQTGANFKKMVGGGLQACREP